MIDTHTHLYLPEFEKKGGGAEAVERAIAAGVEHMVFPNVDLGTIEPMHALAAQFPDRISMAMGLHPTEVRETWREDVDACMQWLQSQQYVAVGEVGIDLYWDQTYADEQMQAFDQQVAMAQQLGLPVIIHCREGLEQTLEVMQDHPEVPAVFHSFGGTVEDVERIRRVGDYYFGINGVVTFKNCHVRDAIADITLDRLLLETDSPYLAPVPKRGRRNESAYLPFVAEHIANHLGIPVGEVDVRTSANARRFFNLQ